MLLPPKKTSIASLKRKLIIAFNAYIRKRDQLNAVSFKCISCGKIKELRLMHAGHYYNAGHYESLRFDEHNVNGQCYRCNRYLHGNLIGYREGLIAKYGEHAIKILDMKRFNKSELTMFTLTMLTNYYKQKLRRLESSK